MVRTKWAPQRYGVRCESTETNVDMVQATTDGPGLESREIRDKEREHESIEGRALPILGEGEVNASDMNTYKQRNRRKRKRRDQLLRTTKQVKTRRK